uniref:Uncharacterized protein n=1 Tax=Quercus lobata TaxID=97700 RepID=A0A7N2LPY5_QUELO
MWSSNGALSGVAYSKHNVLRYYYHGGDDLRNHLEVCLYICVDYGMLSLVISCTLLKGIKHQFTLCALIIRRKSRALGSRYYSVHLFYTLAMLAGGSCINQNKLYQKVLRDDRLNQLLNCRTWGQCCKTMAFSAGGKRLFICETNKEGRSYLLELDEHQVAIKHVYHGLWKRSVGVVPFDTMKIQFLAIGDAFKIKFWDMDNSYLLTTTAAEGGLPAAPCIRFNKEGIAVSTSENGIKILANADGVWLLRCIENQAVGTSRVAPATIEKCRYVPIMVVMICATTWSDLAFLHPSRQLCIITSGEDKTIKGWDAVTGNKLCMFVGHEVLVYSVFPHHKENIQFIFSADINGKIKAWLYDNLGSRIDCDAPGQSCMTMAYSSDRTRLFSCGTSEEGESHFAE